MDARDADDQGWALSLAVDSTWHDASAPFARMERPALAAVDGTVHLAFVAYAPDATPLLAYATATSGGSGWTWSEVSLADSSGGLMGIQGPAFSESGTLGWARLVDQEVQLCTLAAGASEAAASCVDTGATAVRGLTFEGDTLVAGLRDGAGAWTVRSMGG